MLLWLQYQCYIVIHAKHGSLFREEVVDHQVKWRAKFKYAVKMVAAANTGVLEPCICRVSVRKVSLGHSFTREPFLCYAHV